MFILTSVIQCACADLHVICMRTWRHHFKFCSSTRTYQFLLPNVFIPVQKPTGQTYIMLISSVKAVPNHRTKKHNLKKGQMKKDKVFPPVKHINNVWTNKQQSPARHRNSWKQAVPEELSAQPPGTAETRWKLGEIPCPTSERVDGVECLGI